MSHRTCYIGDTSNGQSQAPWSTGFPPADLDRVDSTPPANPTRSIIDERCGDPKRVVNLPSRTRPASNGKTSPSRVAKAPFSDSGAPGEKEAIRPLSFASSRFEVDLLLLSGFADHHRSPSIIYHGISSSLRFSSLLWPIAWWIYWSLGFSHGYLIARNSFLFCRVNCCRLRRIE